MYIYIHLTSFNKKQQNYQSYSQFSLIETSSTQLDLLIYWNYLNNKHRQISDQIYLFPKELIKIAIESIQTYNFELSRKIFEHLFYNQDKVKHFSIVFNQQTIEMTINVSHFPIKLSPTAWNCKILYYQLLKLLSYIKPFIWSIFSWLVFFKKLMPAIKHSVQLFVQDNFIRGVCLCREESFFNNMDIINYKNTFRKNFSGNYVKLAWLIHKKSFSRLNSDLSQIVQIIHKKQKAYNSLSLFLLKKHSIDDIMHKNIKQNINTMTFSPQIHYLNIKIEISKKTAHRHLKIVNLSSINKIHPLISKSFLVDDSCLVLQKKSKRLKTIASQKENNFYSSRRLQAD